MENSWLGQASIKKAKCQARSIHPATQVTQKCPTMHSVGLLILLSYSPIQTAKFLLCQQLCRCEPGLQAAYARGSILSSGNTRPSCQRQTATDKQAP